MNNEKRACWEVAQEKEQMEGSAEQYRGGERGQAYRRRAHKQGTNSAQGQAFSDGNDGSLRCLLKHLGSNYDTHYEAGKGLLKTQPS